MRSRSNLRVPGPGASGLPVRISLAVLLVAGLAVGAPAPVQAEARAEPMRVMLAVPKVVAPRVATRSRAGGFDWLAKRAPARAEVQLVAAGGKLPRQIGRGSWICSPAGFGQKSRCHAN